MTTYYGNLFFADSISAASTNDTLYGFGGNDLLYGNAGNDTLFGGDNDDILFGGTGRDTLYGENGNDELHGGTSNDRLSGGDGNDRLYGDDGDDTLFGDNGVDVLYGGNNNDWLSGGTSNDYLYGDAGNDTFNDREGINYFNGGSGIDTADYSGYSGGISLTLAEGTAEARAVRSGMIYRVGEGSSYFADGYDRLVSIENVRGGLGADTITGNSGVNAINGGGGLDVIAGGGGRDTLTGGTGQDFFVFKTGDAPTAVTLTSGTRLVERITDFNRSEGDYLDLRQMDSDINTATNDRYVYVDQFTGDAGELLLRQDDATHFRLIGDTDGDGFGDMFIDIQTAQAHSVLQMQAGILL